ncbi:MAG: HPr family phosphocarrier protein [Candidatus Aureabacteria bacterium]|jgi:phosphocarrier protein HPr|nr:HPr family phosphocarrier protein [Candidatus Auribacterota bacterium]
MADTVVKKDLTITNRLGLHARPAAMFVQLANKFSSDITVERGNEKVNGKSIMGIMMLAAGKGLKITVTAGGADAAEAVRALEALVKGKFGEG